MCDTILAPPASTAEQTMLFGKNSDRQRNEAQTVEYFARASYPHGAEVVCTYVSIPQAARTHAVLLCRPFWIWGAEMGANEYGVVIGNEALSTRNPGPQEKALVGMDLLRLALERSCSAAEAVETITALLARHGQGGNCGHLKPSFYHNGFMIADAREAFVLETVEREWLVEPVRGPRAISNRYSIQRGQHTSLGLVNLIRHAGWETTPDRSYADMLWDPNREHIGHANARLARSTALLRSRGEALTLADLMRILRDHGGQGSGEAWGTDAASRTICMHAGGDNQPGQTVGAMISELRPDRAIHWVTGTAAPCLGIFKPVLMDVPLPAHGTRPNDRFDSRALWWRHERLHRAALLRNLTSFLQEIREEREDIERQFSGRLLEVMNGGNTNECARVVEWCWKLAIETEDRWLDRVKRMPKTAESSFVSAWAAMNDVAGIDSL